jgi:hypothetical protein
MNNEKLSVEFAEEFVSEFIRYNDVNLYLFKQVSDFWLSKMSSQLEELRKEIEEIRKDYLKNNPKIHGSNQYGFNQAIDEVLKLFPKQQD